MNDAVEKTAQRAEEIKARTDDNTITLSTGVILGVKQVPPGLLIDAMAQFDRPQIPKHFNKSMGRDMENPDDPDYLDRVQAWRMKFGRGAINVLILWGTELIKVPRGFSHPLKKNKKGEWVDGEWIDKLKLADIPVLSDNESWRYLRWVLSEAAVSEDDLNLITQEVSQRSGVPQEDVEAAAEFPGSNKV